MQTFYKNNNMILLIALIMSAALVLTACGDDNNVVANPANNPTTTPSGSNDQICTEVDQSPLPFEMAADDEIAPAPPSIGADVPATYFGPAPSQINPRLIGPLQLLTAGSLDQDAGTLTLPLYKGRLTTGETVWYVLTDTTDRENAEALGLNFSSKLQYADSSGGAAVRTARYINENGETILVFDQGSVDFSPIHSVTPGAAPNFFPPAAFQPGSVGDADYSPLVRIENAGGHIYNAPIVAFNVDDSQINFCDGNPDLSLVHDKVAAICPQDRTVTLALTPGFSFGRPVQYLSTDANDLLASALEGATYAPALQDVEVGADDSAFSAVERIFLFANGPTGTGNPQRQGLNSALSDGRGPLNVLGGIPTIATDYSPLWDVNLGEWTQTAIDNGYRSRLTEEFAILGFVERGWVTGPGGAPYGSTGIIVNCPIVFRFL
jgi:hypothetical protein